MTARFPRVVGRSLLGRELALPAAFPAERCLAIVAFRQWHQASVDRWIARAVAAGLPATVRGATSRLPRAVLELPVLSSAWRPVRGFIDGGMAAGIRDPDVLARTVTLYTNTAAFRRALDIPDDRDVHALVVTRDGELLADVRGEVSETGWQTIASALGID